MTEPSPTRPSALAFNVPIPEELRWTDTRQGREYLLETLNVRLREDGQLVVKAYGRPSDGGRSGYTAFSVPRRVELERLVTGAAREAAQMWSSHTVVRMP